MPSFDVIVYLQQYIIVVDLHQFNLQAPSFQIVTYAYLHVFMYVCSCVCVIIVENIGEFSYLDFLEEKSLANGIIMANGYQIFCEIALWYFANNLPQYFLSPRFSTIQYIICVLFVLLMCVCTSEEHVFRPQLLCYPHLAKIKYINWQLQ